MEKYILYGSITVSMDATGTSVAYADAARLAAVSALRNKVAYISVMQCTSKNKMDRDRQIVFHTNQNFVESKETDSKLTLEGMEKLNEFGTESVGFGGIFRDLVSQLKKMEGINAHKNRKQRLRRVHRTLKNKIKNINENK